jgi:hypothetical protein
MTGNDRCHKCGRDEEEEDAREAWKSRRHLLLQALFSRGNFLAKKRVDLRPQFCFLKNSREHSSIGLKGRNEEKWKRKEIFSSETVSSRGAARVEDGTLHHVEEAF